MKRRDFFGALAGLGAVGAARGPSAALSAIPSPGTTAGPPPEAARAAGRLHGRTGRLPEAWGVQLYTVRARMAEDVPATLEAVAGMGYGEVEFAGLFDFTPREMRGLLDGLGLRGASMHVGIEGIGPERVKATMDEAEILGLTHVIVPSLPGDLHNPGGYRRVAEILNAAGEEAGKRGLVVGFHNHGREVQPAEEGGSESGLEIMLTATDAATVSFQLDLFWAVNGGADPLDYFRRHPGRFISVHAKDRTADGEMVHLGGGVMDFAALLDAGEAAGVRHVFVEHDRPDDPLESIRLSIAHLNTLRG